MRIQLRQPAYTNEALMRTLETPFSHRLEDLAPRDRPEPQPPGRGQVLVRVQAAGLNYRDLLVATGHDRWLSPADRILGSDAVGTIIATGPETERFAIGSRVITTILPKWISGPLTPEKRKGGLGGPAADGVFAETICLDAAGLVAAPAYLTNAEAAAVPVAALTAWHALTRGGALRPGATVLVEGTGGVSLFALQIAVAARATVIATSSSEAKLERLRSLGASATLNYNERADWGEEVLKLTDGRGVDLAVDIGGAASLNQSIKATAMGGVVSIVGLVGGLRAEIDLGEVFQKNLRLDGIETGSRTMLEEMLTWFEDKRIKPVIDSTFPFDDARDAFLRLREGRHFGKVCLSF